MAIIFDPIMNTTKTVKNLGWLLRHAHEVTGIRVEWSTYPENGEVFLRAKLQGGKEYGTFFTSRTVCMEWIKRPCLKGIPIQILSEEWSKSTFPQKEG